VDLLGKFLYELSAESEPEEDGDDDDPDEDDEVLPEWEPCLIGLLSNQDDVKKEVEPEGERKVLYNVRVLFKFWAEGSDKEG
jgi:hypothetical protein